MSVENVEIATSKGPCKVEIVTAGPGRKPALIFVPDAGGQRGAMTEMAERIAERGYLVAIWDQFYSSGQPWDLLPPGEHTLTRFMAIWQDDGLRQRFMKDYYAVATSLDVIEPGLAPLFPYLKSRDDVKQGKFGITGYCLGGNISLRAAALFPEEIGAAASIHGGGLVTDAPDSPVHLVDRIRAEVLVAGAIEDPSFTDEQKAKLEKALADAKVRHTVETYPARHGFAVPDHASIYDPAAADRHYDALDKLLRRAIA